MDENAATIVFDQVGCARCGGDGHDQIEFHKLTHPMELDDGMRGTHWAPCPTNGEPIFLFFFDTRTAEEE